MSLKTESKKRLSPALVEADVAKTEALRRLGARYTPQRAEFSLRNISEADAEVVAATSAERAAEAVLAAARDRTRIAEHKRHDLLVGATEQVSGQFGKDSDEYQSLGLKKKAEYGR